MSRIDPHGGDHRTRVERTGPFTRPSRRRGSRRAESALLGLALLALSLFVLLYGLGEKDFWERAEARSGLAAREMLSSGEFLVPTQNGVVFVDNRPPGFYWLVALSFALTGVESELTARLPAALLGIGCVLLVFRFVRELAGPRGGFLAGLILLGTAKFTFQARSAEQDAALAFWTLLAAWALWNALRHPDGSWAWSAVFHLSLGLGALTKGPAVVITAAIPAAFWLLFSRPRRGRVLWPLLVLSPISAGLAAWWYIYILSAGPVESRQLAVRLASQSSQHVRSSLYYLVKLPALLGLSTPLVPLLVRRWHLAPRRERAILYCLVWSFLPVLVFSLFPSKQTHYLVPSFPPLAVAAGLAIRRVGSAKYLRILSAVVGVGVVLTASTWKFFAPESVRVVDMGASGWFALLTSLTLAGAAVVVSVFRQRSGAGFPLAWTAALVLMAFALGKVLPSLDETQSPRRFAESVTRIMPGGAPLATTSSHPGLVYYLGRSVRKIPHSAADSYLSGPSPRYLIFEAREPAEGPPESGEILLRQEPYLHQGRAAYLLRSRR